MCTYFTFVIVYIIVSFVLLWDVIGLLTVFFVLILVGLMLGKDNYQRRDVNRLIKRRAEARRRGEESRAERHRIHMYIMIQELLHILWRVLFVIVGY